MQTFFGIFLFLVERWRQNRHNNKHRQIWLGSCWKSWSRWWYYNLYCSYEWCNLKRDGRKTRKWKLWKFSSFHPFHLSLARFFIYQIIYFTRDRWLLLILIASGGSFLFMEQREKGFLRKQFLKMSSTYCDTLGKTFQLVERIFLKKIIENWEAATQIVPENFPLKSKKRLCHDYFDKYSKIAGKLWGSDENKMLKKNWSS